jgi:hypothetical protein
MQEENNLRPWFVSSRTTSLRKISVRGDTNRGDRINSHLILSYGTYFMIINGITDSIKQKKVQSHRLHLLIYI